MNIVSFVGSFEKANKEGCISPFKKASTMLWGLFITHHRLQNLIDNFSHEEHKGKANPKSEYLNPNQIQNSNIKNLKNEPNHEEHEETQRKNKS